MFDFTTEVFIDKVGFVYPLPNDVDQALLLEPFNQIRLDAKGQVIALDRLQVDELHRHIRHEGFVRLKHIFRCSQEVVYAPRQA